MAWWYCKKKDIWRLGKNDRLQTSWLKLLINYCFIKWELKWVQYDLRIIYSIQIILIIRWLITIIIWWRLKFDYKINDDDSIDVRGDVHLSNKGLSKLPLKFNLVYGSFYCDGNQLTTLEGAPRTVGGDFSCSYNQLSNLEGAPISVGGGFSCSHNQLETLEDAPRTVGGSFNCSHNQLTSLEGAPTSVGGNFDCSYNQLTNLEGAPTSVDDSFLCDNNQLTSLEGAPTSVGGDFSCYNNQLTSLEGSPTSVGRDFSCNYNQLTSLEGSPRSVGGHFDCNYNPIYKWWEKINDKEKLEVFIDLGIDSDNPDWINQEKIDYIIWNI